MGNKESKTAENADILEEPWRDQLKWNDDQFLSLLKADIMKFTPHKSVKVKKSNILLIGPVQAGKSSFFNTIASAFSGYMREQAPSGCTESTLTTKFRKYRIPAEKPGNFLKFNLCDTRGLEENGGIDSDFLLHLLDGRIPDNCEIMNVLEIPEFKKDTALNDYIHCVGIVLDGSTLSGLSPTMVTKIRNLLAKIREKGIPVKVIITKIDKVSQTVDNDTSKVFRSKCIKEKVDEVSERFGLPRHSILLVKNYEAETEVKKNIDILVLLALRDLLRATEDDLLNYMPDEEGESDTSVKD